MAKTTTGIHVAPGDVLDTIRKHMLVDGFPLRPGGRIFDIADTETDTQQCVPLEGRVRVEPGNGLLNRDGGTDGAGDIRKLGNQCAVAAVEDQTAVLADQSLGENETGGRGASDVRIVGGAQPARGDGIGGQDRREPAPRFIHLLGLFACSMHR